MGSVERAAAMGARRHVQGIGDNAGNVLVHTIMLVMVLIISML